MQPLLAEIKTGVGMKCVLALDEFLMLYFLNP